MNFIKAFNQKSITFRIVVLIWGLIIFTIAFYIFISIPYQKQSLIERMKFEAQDVASSYIEANKSALITDDYQLIVDYSISTVKNSNSIQYIAVDKLDSTQSFLFTKKGWSGDDLGKISLSPGYLTEGGIIESKVINGEVFHLSKKFIYTGIEWGWIHIGLSTESYNKAANEMIIRAILLALATTLLSFFATYLFTKKLTKPISDLAIMTKRIESGDLSARVSIRSKDELGLLADSFNKMTDAVSKSRENLENKVQERTTELAKTNEQLTVEIEERKKTEYILNQYTVKLQTLEEIYKGIISSKSPVEIFKNSAQKIYDNIVNFSRSSAAIFDFSNGSAILYAFTFEANQVLETEENFLLSHFSSIEKLQEVDYFVEESLPAKKHKSQMENLVFNKGVNSYICVGLKFQGQLIGELNFAFTDSGKIEKSTIDTILEISNQVAVAIVQLSLEEKLKQHADDLQNSLKEKEVLLKEIHHRVKNNLQIITSLLYLQSLKIDDNETQSIFKDSQNRVKSLALVHEKLYQSKDLARIDFSDYLKNLTNFIFTTYKTNIANLNIEYDLDEVYLSVEISVPLGLIINELLSNSLKYAFAGLEFDESNQHKITLSLKNLTNGNYLLSVSDNGKGLPDHFNIEETESLGLKLVTSLVQQIDAKLEIHSKNNTEFNITFSTDYQ
jgi:two-component sensor histidine kinase/methyl-accepting chemotaxis protein